MNIILTSKFCPYCSTKSGDGSYQKIGSYIILEKTRYGFNCKICNYIHEINLNGEQHEY